MLSVLAVQERLTCDEDTAVAVKPVGVAGAWVSLKVAVTETA